MRAEREEAEAEEGRGGEGRGREGVGEEAGERRRDEKTFTKAEDQV